MTIKFSTTSNNKSNLLISIIQTYHCLYFTLKCFINNNNIIYEIFKL